MLVDGRPDDDHDVLGVRDDDGVVARLEPAGGEHLLEQRVGALLEERHLAGADPVDGRRVAVVAARPSSRRRRA